VRQSIGKRLGVKGLLFLLVCVVVVAFDGRIGRPGKGRQSSLHDAPVRLQFVDGLAVVPGGVLGGASDFSVAYFVHHKESHQRNHDGYRHADKDRDGNVEAATFVSCGRSGGGRKRSRVRIKVVTRPIPGDVARDKLAVLQNSEFDSIRFDSIRS